MPSNQQRSNASGVQAESASIAKNPTGFFKEHMLLLLIGLRLVNALTTSTYFQPDEYYQALEPAWWLAFGEGSGAWITWEWKHHLRSALPPTLFALVYKAVEQVSLLLQLQSHTKASLYLAAPKTLSAIIAALGDYYTCKLSEHVYGEGSYPALCTLWLTAGSAWNWFVSTRSFSNCAETTLTVIALYNWPFQWALGADEVVFQVDSKTLRVRHASPIQPCDTGADVDVDTDETTRIRRSLFSAAAAIILRPTNAIIWMVIIFATFGRGMYHHGVHWEVGAFLREGVFCGSVVLTLSALVDRLFYGVWTLPMWQFFKINVLQSVAVFYGNNNWHYYLSQGYPLLLTLTIIPALFGVYTALFRPSEPASIGIQSRLILHRLAIIAIALPAVLSILSHKEVRFIYPVLPALHVLAARPLSVMLGFPDVIGKADIKTGRSLSSSGKAWLVLLVVQNLLVAGFFTYSHNSGLITLTEYLRTEFETKYALTTTTTPPSVAGENLTFAILMPCHSLPWRSHLQYSPTSSTPGISGWALTCEPPLNLTVAEKTAYKDEADIFYLNPSLWVTQNMVRDLPKGPPSPGVYAPDPINAKKLWSNPNPNRGVWIKEGDGGSEAGFLQRRKRAWPDYLVAFEQLEPAMQRILDGSAYVECARFWNTFFHDDLRRKGHVIVWCLPEHLRGGIHRKEKRSGLEKVHKL